MATKTEPAIYNSTSPCVMAFPNLLEARAYKKNGVEKGEPKFGCTLVLSPNHPDYAGMKAKAIEAAKARWPGVDPKTVKFPFQLGDKQADKRKAAGKEDGDFMRGHIVLKCNSKFAPALSVLDNGKIVDVDSDILKAAHKGKFFFGVEVLAQVNFVAYEMDEEDENGNKRKGVTCYLNMVLSTGKGKKLSSGSPSAASAFSGYVGNVSAYDPTDDLTVV